MTCCPGLAAWWKCLPLQNHYCRYLVFIQHWVNETMGFCLVDLIHAVQYHLPGFSKSKTAQYTTVYHIRHIYNSVLWSLSVSNVYSWQVGPFHLGPACQPWAVCGTTTVHWRCVAKSTCTFFRELFGSFSWGYERHLFNQPMTDLKEGCAVVWIGASSEKINSHSFWFLTGYCCTSRRAAFPAFVHHNLMTQGIISIAISGFQPALKHQSVREEDKKPNLISCF